MSEKRRPDVTFKITHAGRLSERYELFSSDQFTARRWDGQPKVDADGNKTYRLRFQGRWLPPEPVLIPVSEVFALIKARLEK